jgi:phosphoserine phosphatase
LDASTLTDAGIAMAEQVGQALQGLRFDAIYSSPLQRARATAEVIAASLDSPPDIQSSDLLLEVDLPLWEGLEKSQVQAQYPEAYRTWATRPADFFMELPGKDGEDSPSKHYPVRSLFDQAREFWQATLPQHDGQTVLIVGHNGILRSLICTAVGMGPEQYQVIRQSNCGLSVLNFEGGLGDSVQLESINLTAHLGDDLPDHRLDQGCRLLLVRHGETEWNRMSRFQGQIDIPLNDTGRAQAQKAAEFLKPVAIDAAITSPLSRPKETAQIILQYHPGIELGEVAALKEIGHGLWEGKLEAEIRAEYEAELTQWKLAPETVQMPEGENLQQVWDRGVAAWESIVAEAAPGSTVLVVAHDAVNKAILCHVLGLQPKHIWAVKQGNGAVTIVDYPKGLAGGPTLQALNITTHFGQGVIDQTAAGAL